MSVLRTKMPKYLKQLAAVYERKKDSTRHGLIANGRWELREGVDFDNYNESTGHSLVLFAPMEALAEIEPDDLTILSNAIQADIQRISTAQNEHVHDVLLEAEDENDPEYQGATPFSDKPTVNPDHVSIWKPGLARIFISHRDGEKARVQNLADALEGYGMSCFVAHETIPADEEWQKVIEDGLDTMELMVAVVTDDFHDSVYCMQEVGYALGRGVPVISLKVGKKDPRGFISKKQAQKGSLDNPIKAAKDLFPTIGDRLRRLERLNDILVNSFCGAQDWSDARSRFERLKSHVEKLTQEQVSKIVAAFAKNDQLYRAAYLVNHHRRLIKYLDSATDGSWVIKDRKLVDQNTKGGYDDLDDDVPF